MRFYTREESGVGPKKGDEPAEEDNLPPWRRNKYWPTLSRGSLSRTYLPYRATKRIPIERRSGSRCVAYDGGRGRDEHDQSDTDLVRRSGVESGRHQAVSPGIGIPMLSSVTA